MKKRVPSGLLTAVFVLALSFVLSLFISGTSYAEELEERAMSGKSNNVEWSIDDQGCLTITGTGDWAREDYMQTPWEYNPKVTSAVVNLSGATNLNGMLGYLQNLKTVDLTNLDTSLAVNMSYMFAYDENLESVDLSGFNTSNVEIMDNMFLDCEKVTKLNVSNFDTSKVADFSHMFSGMKSLKSLDVSNFNTSNLGNSFLINGYGYHGIDYMFSGCESLKTMDISNFDLHGAWTLFGVFCGCTSLESVNVSGLDTSNIQSVQDLFGACMSLKTLDLSTWDLSKVTYYWDSFLPCTNCTMIAQWIPDYKNNLEVFKTPKYLGTDEFKFFYDAYVDSAGKEYLYIPATKGTSLTLYKGRTLCEHYGTSTKPAVKATTTKDGKTESVICNNCGTVIKESKVISKASTVKLSATTYTYDGTVKKPAVTVKDSKGKTIASTNYTVKYPTGRKNVGTYTVKVTFKGNYTGSKSLTFKINPAKTSISKLTALSKGFTVKWAKKTTQVTGYQIQYSRSSTFASGNKTVTVSSNTTVSKSIKSLLSSKKYYVRVRTYKTVNGTKYYSAWSAKKYVTTKK